jgi:subtilisin family serine protease
MINELSTLTGIKKVEPEPKWKLYNNIAADIMTVRTSRDTHGLYGLGQTVGICDSGLDQGTVIPSGLHDDFEDGDGTSRVIQIFDVAGDSDTSDVNSGHGTHVSGSVLGNGINSGSNPLLNSFPDTSFSGIAPKANLILQASEDNSGGYLNLPIDLNILFEEADNAGADLHTNSWGEPVASAYNSSSEEVDQYIWDNKDFLIFFAAGNDGIDSDSDGVIDLYSIGAPATAKNCLTIGATENLRSTGGYDFQWATGSWAPDYPVNPIFSDLISDDAYGMAAFSSRGPTLDGRYKPDLVAPGTNIVSVRSSMAALTGWGIYDDNYLYMGGTSMSTPLAAGTAALLREYLITVKGFVTPSAALLKAALLNSAEDISPGQYGIGLFQEIPSSPVPNNVEGWGRINFANSVYPEGSFGINYYDEQTGLSTGNYNEYTVDVYDSSRPLKVNLVWTDYPGSSSVQGGLVNDLDLQITTPSQEVIYPDNAILPSVAADLSYYDLTPEYYTSNLVAVKLTPSAYPSIVVSVSIGAYSTLSEPSGLGNIEIYDDNGADGMPGDLLYGAIVWDLSHFSLETILIDGPTITDGSFYVAVGTFFPNDNILLDDEDYGVSYYHNGIAWLPDTGYTSYIGATVLQPGSDAPDFDRTNNVVGLTLNNPESGTYTLRVNGYNVPQGPQPYALVVSGEIVEILCSDNDDDTYSPDGGGCGEIDCDDTIPEIHPNAEEICNGIDDNCDGAGLSDTDEDEEGDVCDDTPGCEVSCGNDPCELGC